MSARFFNLSCIFVFFFYLHLHMTNGGATGLECVRDLIVTGDRIWFLIQSSWSLGCAGIAVTEIATQVPNMSFQSHSKMKIMLPVFALTPSRWGTASSVVGNGPLSLWRRTQLQEWAVMHQREHLSHGYCISQVEGHKGCGASWPFAFIACCLPLELCFFLSCRGIVML